VTVHFDLIDWNEVALEVVETTRMAVYDTHRLSGGNGKRTAKGKSAPDAEHRRRKAIRRLNKKLSRYYLLETNQAAWGCPELLKKGKHAMIIRLRILPLTHIFQCSITSSESQSCMLSHPVELRFQLRAC